MISSHQTASSLAPVPHDTGNWLIFRKPRPKAELRLLCFHHAGGAALAYRSWTDRMPDFIDVCPVQLPGRGTRYGEDAHTRVERLVPSLLRAIRPLLDRPVALFGHSMGAALAFATAQALERSQTQVLHLFASGRRPPLPEYRTQLHRMGDAELTAYLRQLGGTPEIVFQEEELKHAVFSLLRADLEMNDHFQASSPLLNVPITALGGDNDDHVPVAALEDWRRLTHSSFSRQLFSGGHFFVRDMETAVIQHVTSTLSASVACPL
ncbi:thioesterase [Chromobacterium sp. ATCC 53434]|uniref:thioesterase II family protein n=1 Tax=Chromobacterium sp. (strain ATCC 53434 / SC 14030) TaxID=2059672 RepID=UPI000C775366|nr:alpha/beta fold hydrolase [Chromobacterium sp. ATCC 53434]AUH51872.1 thioesterase [Chromobacterium sp. ATCC 53434]